MNNIHEFKNAMRNSGIEPPDEIIADEQIHRFGKKQNCWYVLHGDNLPAGAFGDWSKDCNTTWCAGRQLTENESVDLTAKIATAKARRDAETAQAQASAAKTAQARWNAAKPCTEHSYLTKKGVQSFGLRVDGDLLLIPLTDGEKITTLQTIDAAGNKRFMKGGKKGYFIIGEIIGASHICIVEGYATAASIHEATGLPVVVSFDAGNLKPTAEMIHSLHPDARIIVCADDDFKTDGNPGMTKAVQAARAVCSVVAVPIFENDRPDDATDFNDMAMLYGLDSVCNVIKSHVTDVTSVTANNDVACGVTPEELPDVTGVTNPEEKPDGISIPTEERPCYKVFNVRTKTVQHGELWAGVWYLGYKQPTENAPEQLTKQWICTPVHVEAVTHDAQDQNYGRLLRFQNTNKRWRKWAMPMELLKARGDELRGELLSMGVQIDPKAHTHLTQFLQALTPKERVICALQVGWCNRNFVLPGEVIGENSSGVIFQSGERTHDEYTTAGTFEGWRDGIASLAPGNPLLMVALSSAFAGPLLKLCHGESGGIHLVGDSASGKSTAAQAACSVWGGEGYKRSWRATSNGMEGAAATFNDSLLALDEIGECEPREIGAIIYSLGNGSGKQRASRTGNARSVTRWRCFVLSNGEHTIRTAMQEGGMRTKAGQEMRLLDIPAARRYGAWDHLHGFDTGVAMSDAIKITASAHHGHAGRAFLEKLTRDDRDFPAMLHEMKERFKTDGGQESRGAARFAMIALAGELATEYGVTGWQQGEATQAALTIYQTWRNHRGGGNNEQHTIVGQVADFIDRHGDSRFNSSTANAEHPLIRDRAGWWRDSSDGDRIYLFNAAGLREALKGFDFKRGLAALQDAGAISKGNGERAKTQRIGGRIVKVYEINAQNLQSVTPVTPENFQTLQDSPIQNKVVTPVTPVTPQKTELQTNSDAAEVEL